MRAYDVVIAGAGVGGVQTARTLRQLGFDGSVVLLSDEREAPYDRPPLSKGFLLGKVSETGIRLPDAGCELVPASAVGLDPAAHAVRLSDGGRIGYGRLVVATGARSLRLPLLDGLDGVHQLRSADDARRLRAALASRPRVAIVGAGLIGLEVAAAAKRLGCPVTVVEAESAPLARTIGPQLGGWLREWHERHGVAFRCGRRVRRALGAGRVERLELSDGEALDVDVVVVGIGVVPNVEWLGGSGLALHRGLLCDGDGRSSDPDVLGVGDVACRHVGGRCRPSGHWTAATEQALRVAELLVDGAAAGRARLEGSFWSDQFDLRLQFAGAVPPGARIDVVEGSLAARRFVALCVDRDVVTGVLAADSPRAFARRAGALASHDLPPAVDGEYTGVPLPADARAARVRL